MGFCGGIVKASLFILNFVLFLGGVLIMAAGGYMHYQIAMKYDTFFDDKGSKAGIFGVAVGAVVALVSFLGCCGLMKKSSCMLKTYGVMVAVLLIAEIGIGIAATLYKGEAEGYLTRGMNSALNQYDPADKIKAPIVEIWDETQEGLQCCGVTGYTDWKDADKWTKKTDVPDSCCKEESENCGQGAIANPSSINQTGCKDKLVEEIKANIGYVVWAGMGFGLFQIILIVAACVLGKKMGYDDELWQTV